MEDTKGPEGTRGAIMRAARDRYLKDGPARTSIRQIARDAGVSVALVYHYFKDKEAVYDACIDKMYVELPAIVVEAQNEMDQAGSFEDFVEALVRRMFRYSCENRPWLTMLQRSVLENRGLDERRREGFQIPFLDNAAEGFAAQSGQSADYLRLAIQSTVLLVVRYAVSGDQELEVFTRAEDPAAAIEDHLVEVAKRLLLAPPRP